MMIIFLLKQKSILHPMLTDSFVILNRLEIFDPIEFNKWVEKAIAPAIEHSLKLYKQVLSLGFKVFLLTGRRESHRQVTVDNLIYAGFQDWHMLILR